jgi:hypothetical protein
VEGWNEFNVAMAGASAALAGLIMIAISVNIKEVLRFPSISARAAAAIAALVVAVVASCVSLMPQPIVAIGIELLVASAILWIVEGNAIRGLLVSPASGHSAPHRTVAWKAGNVALGLLPPLAFTLGAVLLAAGIGVGAFPVAFGSLLAVVSAVLFAWVAMVEILR